MRPEFEKVVALSSLKPAHDLETIITLNKAADCNMRVESRINNILSSNKEFWNEDVVDVTEVSEQYFVIQQRLLENFLSAVQIEIENIS